MDGYTGIKHSSTSPALVVIELPASIMAGSLAFLSAIEIWRCHPVDVDDDDDDDEENNVMEPYDLQI